MDVEKESGELDRPGSGADGRFGAGTFIDGHGLPDAPGAARDL